MDELDKAVNACSACKRYKRKCDKVVPACSTCLRLRRPCNYSTTDAGQSSQHDEIARLRARVDELEHTVNSRTEVTSTGILSPPITQNRNIKTHNPTNRSVSASLFFLDQKFFTHLHCSVEPVSMLVPDSIANILAEDLHSTLGVDQLVHQYFESLHGWMPIISKIRLRRVLSRTKDSIRADTAFLLSCMKLLLYVPEDGSDPEAYHVYAAVKEFNLQLEIAGLHSLMVVQGGLLIAVYEIGHGIYPAAYTTIAQCARQGISLGVHNQEVPQYLQPWTDWEEQIRVWWFVVMLDRHVTIGREFRPLCTEDPKKYTPLPEDNETWDRGAMVAPERLYVSSPATSIASPYARLAQAFNLLGRVIRHCDDQDQDPSFQLDEMSTLHQATSALLELTVRDKTQYSYISTAVCYSTLMKLHKNYLGDAFSQRPTSSTDFHISHRIRERSEQSYNALVETSSRIVEFAISLERRIATSGVDQVSPLVLHCIYRAAFWMSYLLDSTGDETFAAGRLTCHQVLKVLEPRWALAGTYLRILDTAKIVIERSVG